jgi:hypothetical protein
MTFAQLHPDGHYIRRQPTPGRLAFGDELVPYDVPLLILYSDRDLTEVKPPNSPAVTVFDHELAEPNFCRLPLEPMDKELYRETLLELINRPPLGNPIDPQLGQRFRRTGRPISAIQPHFIYPADGEIEVTHPGATFVYYTNGRSSEPDPCVSRKYFTDAYVVAV